MRRADCVSCPCFLGQLTQSARLLSLLLLVWPAAGFVVAAEAVLQEVLQADLFLAEEALLREIFE